MNQKKSSILLLSTLALGLLPQLAIAPTSVVADEKVSESSEKLSFDSTTALNKAIQKQNKKDTEELQKQEKERITSILEQKGVKNPTKEKIANTPVNVFVQLKEKPAIQKVGVPNKKKSNLHAILQEEKATIEAQSSDKTKVQQITNKRKIKRSFGYLYNGFETTATYSEIQKIKNLSNVKSVSVDKTFHLTDTNANELGQIKDAWKDTESHASVKGENMVVAVLDSGIDYKHKDLRLSEGTPTKVTESFVNQVVTGDDTHEGIQHGKYLSEKVPFAYNYADHDDVYLDTAYERHGQHVAGIIAANGEDDNNYDSVKGVAPEAQLLDMKVFGNYSASMTSYEPVIQAIEDSVKLGADVMNMSFGSDLGAEANDPEQVAVREASKKGVLSVIAAGNSEFFSSETGDRSIISTPAVAKSALTVASYNNQKQTVSSGIYLNGHVNENSTTVAGILPNKDGVEQFAYNSRCKFKATDKSLTAIANSEIVLLPQSFIKMIQSSPAGNKEVLKEAMNGVKESYDTLDEKGVSVAGKIIAVFDQPYHTSFGKTPSGNLYSTTILPEILHQAHKHNVKGILFLSNTQMPNWSIDGDTKAMYDEELYTSVSSEAENDAAKNAGKMAGENGTQDNQTALNRIDLPAMKMNLSARAGGSLTVDGEELKLPGLTKYLEENPETTFTFDQVITTKEADAAYQQAIGYKDAMSEFSSWGPTPELELKPDITGVGGNVWSLDNNNKYQSMSGTSMATPFVAGSAALVIQNLKNSGINLENEDLINLEKVMLTNTSKVLTESTKTTQGQKGNIISPRYQGSGLVQIEEAIENKTLMQDVIDNDGLFALKEINGDTATFEAKLTNLDKKAHSYTFKDYSGVQHEDPKYKNTYIPKILQQIKDKTFNETTTMIEEPWDTKLPNASISADENVVTLAENESKTVQFTLHLPSESDKEFVEGFVGFTREDNKEVHMPYFGFHGDYGNWSDNIPGFTDKDEETGTTSTFNVFSDLKGYTYLPNENNITAFSNASTGSSQPQFSLFSPVDHFIRHAKVTIENEKGNVIANVGDDYNINKDNGKGYTFPNWNGLVWDKVNGKYQAVEDGNYFYCISTENSFSKEPQVKRIPFTIDKKAPTLKNARVLHLPEDINDPMVQEKIQSGNGSIDEYTKGTFIAVEMEDNIGFDKTTTISFATPQTSFTHQVSKTPGKNKLLMKLLPQEADVIDSTHGITPFELSIADSARNVGITSGTYQNDEGFSLWNATLNGNTFVKNGNSFIRKGQDNEEYYCLQGSCSLQDGEKLYVDNEEVTLDNHGWMNQFVKLPASRDHHTFIFTTEKYDTYKEAEDHSIGNTTIYYYKSLIDLQMNIDGVSNNDLSGEGYVSTIPTRQVYPIQYSPQATVRVTQTDGEGISVDNALTGGKYSAGIDGTTGVFHVPLQNGLNMITATTRHTETNFGDFISQKGRLLTKVTDEDVHYRNVKKGMYNIFSRTTAINQGFYDESRNVFLLKGDVGNFDIYDCDNFNIFAYSNDKNDERNKVKINDDFSFCYEIPLKLNEEKVLHYSYEVEDGKENKGTFTLKVSGQTSHLEIDNATTTDGTHYDIYTNKDSYPLSGVFFHDGTTSRVLVNGNVVRYCAPYDNLDEKESTAVSFKEDVELIKSSTGESVTKCDVLGQTSATNQNIVVNIHRLNQSLVAPKVNVSDKNKETCEPKEITVTNLSKITVGTVQWSLDQKEWQDYTDAVSIPMNATVFFKTVDNYGNESSVTKVDVTNILNNLQVVAQFLGSTCQSSFYALNLNQAVSNGFANSHKIQVSFDKQAWSNYNKNKGLVIPKGKVAYARVPYGNGKYSEILEIGGDNV